MEGPEKKEKLLFISHASEDADIVSTVADFAEKIGLDRSSVFCSSLPGQGVKNGERITEVIKDKFLNADLVVYVISTTFLNKPFCTQELGASWIQAKPKNIFIFKLEDVDPSEIKGFITSDHKYSSFDETGLFELADMLIDVFSLKQPKAIDLHRSVDAALKNSLITIKRKVENKNKTSQEIAEEKNKALENQYEYLSIGEKVDIAIIFFSADRCEYFPLYNSTINLLENKSIVARISTVSNPDCMEACSFAYTLQPWMIKFICKNDDLRKELKQLLDRVSAARR
jgi:hypothetical protein